MRDKELEQRQVFDDGYQSVFRAKLCSSFLMLVFHPGCEAFRHIKLLESGQAVTQETRGFEEQKAQTFKLRSKEDAPDYRYMPDPNLPPLLIDQVTAHSANALFYAQSRRMCLSWLKTNRGT
jgi:Asp-tRNA(Asn)/Glu-tRNA(Gln) amidotransferase B subunit